MPTVHANENNDGDYMSDLDEVRELGPIDGGLIEFDQPLLGAFVHVAI